MTIFKKGKLKLPLFLSHINPTKETNELLRLLRNELYYLFHYHKRIKGFRKELRYVGIKTKHDKELYKLYGLELKKDYRKKRYLEDLIQAIEKEEKIFEPPKKDEVILKGIRYDGEPFHRRVVTVTFPDFDEYIPNKFNNFLRGFIDTEFRMRIFKRSIFRIVLSLKPYDLTEKIILNIKKVSYDRNLKRIQKWRKKISDESKREELKKGILKYMEQGDGLIHISTTFITYKEGLLERTKDIIVKFLSQYFLKSGNIAIKKIVLVEEKIF